MSDLGESFNYINKIFNKKNMLLIIHFEKKINNSKVINIILITISNLFIFYQNFF